MFAVAITATGQKSNPPVLGNGGLFSIDKVTDTSVSISWEPARDDNTPREEIRYHLLYQDPHDTYITLPGIGEWKGDDLGYTTSYTLTGLRKNTEYPIGVVVMDKDNNERLYLSPLSDKNGTSIIRTDNGKGPTPGIARITEVTSKSIALSWTPATDDATEQHRIRYHVAWWEPGANFVRYSNTIVLKKKATGGVWDGSYTIGDLEPNTKYLVAITAMDDAEHGDFYWPTYNARMVQTRSVSAEAGTLPPDQTRPVIKRFGVGKVQARSIELKWDHATDNRTPRGALQYSVCWTNDRNNQTRESGYQPILSYTITQLEPSTTYRVSVKVKDEAGNVAQTPYRGIRTAEGINPRMGRVSVDEVKSKKIRLSWDAATDNATPQHKLRYRVGWHESQDPSGGQQTDWMENITSYTIRDDEYLTPESEFDIWVSVMDEAGNEADFYPQEGRITTPEGEAPTLEDPEIALQWLDDGRLLVSWDYATDNETPHDELLYKVTVTDTKKFMDGLNLGRIAQDIERDIIKDNLERIKIELPKGIKLPRKRMVKKPRPIRTGWILGRYESEYFTSGSISTATPPPVPPLKPMYLLVGNIMPGKTYSINVRVMDEAENTAFYKGIKVSAPKKTDRKIAVGKTIGGTQNPPIELLSDPLSAKPSAWTEGKRLYIDSPVAERVDVYTAAGKRLLSLNKPTGQAVYDLSLPQGIIVVKGETWTHKIVVR